MAHEAAAPKLPGPLHCEAGLAMAGDKTELAQLPRASQEAPELAVGKPAWARFDAFRVILPVMHGQPDSATCTGMAP